MTRSIAITGSDRLRRPRFRPAKALAVVAVHAVAIAAPWTVSRSAVACWAIALAATGQCGINLGFHRLLAHRSFRTPRWFERLLALLGTLAMQTGPVSWVGMHRRHHAEADTPLDPHTPRAGLPWSHFLWAFFERTGVTDPSARRALARDLVRDPFLQFLERHFVVLNATVLALLFGAGVFVGGLAGGVSLLVWGGCLRVVCIWHMTFIVNSVNHTWGYRNYDTDDDSRNNAWVSLLVFGEGWHNNHHADPRSAAHGRRWFELDLGFGMIRIMEVLGMAYDVIRPTAAAAPGRGAAFRAGGTQAPAVH
jgi:fatty-acid desaturase